MMIEVMRVLIYRYFLLTLVNEYKCYIVIYLIRIEEINSAAIAFSLVIIQSDLFCFDFFLCLFDVVVFLKIMQ
jgi:hypothetical protein